MNSSARQAKSSSGRQLNVSKLLDKKPLRMEYIMPNDIIAAVLHMVDKVDFK